MKRLIMLLWLSGLLALVVIYALAFLAATRA